jgi:hypothetical protein
VTHGGLICGPCLIEEHPRNWISSETANLLLTLSTESSPDWEAFTITSEQMRTVRTIMNSTIAHVLGRRPKMQRYLPF